ncbi:cadmium-translocating P-type ATPase [Bradyrhizobium sp. INPA01-394B]|uniref:P-type Zn(2+) transporter n=1 Tax=Bradyrhizobium campsiandrae TaxID=1729892 RepID=A0ABR7U2P2_9BRAD|nr:heavy metal translocating P-type ATPase [Bradyrhizobium campsiandrae]MBC9877694.1 cadmium-translocating P-type ATPase [Bradyrhizobium campsiandrae]MBC9978221.1 cadmium-translocating P-type ATPase [Bradyrhizobium campsiandrae]
MNVTARVAKVRFRVEGMDCASCATKIETALRRVPGVTEVAVSVAGGTVIVSRDDDRVDDEKLRNRISDLGYRVEPVRSDLHDQGVSPRRDDPQGHGHAPVDGSWWRTRKGLLTLASGAALAGAFAVGKIAPVTERWAFLLAMLVGLVPIARRALSAARSGTPFSIEMLMSIAAVGAVIIGATEEAATVVFLFLIGELLEGVAASRARASIRDLTKLVPKTARLEADGQVREVQANSLEVGTTIQVRPGDRIPADGVILSGESPIDEAPVTGESTPVRKGPDALVFAGTVNGDGLLRVRVTAAAADNTIARVIRLVEEAQESKAPTERFIDRFSRFYTPGVVAVAGLVAIGPPLLFSGDWSGWIYKGLAILLIGCPCALVISTPAAIAASLAAGARRGLLMKGGAVLEQVGKITVACFDKTGTLTAGKPQVTDIIGFSSSEAHVLRLAAALESGSSHPLATAILAKASEQRIALPQVADSKAIGGKGIQATIDGRSVFLGSPAAVAELSSPTSEQTARIAALNDEGKTVSLLSIGNEVAGAIAMRDEPRPDAKAGLKRLTDAGIRTLMLTGDNRRAARAIGQELGIEVRAELLPQDKQRIVGELRRDGSSVAKIGDGINDAPALAAADVGIAMGGGTDVALETADAAVLHGRVTDVAAMVDLSKRTMANIRQNIAIALGLKAFFLVTTIVGLTGLWPAILADTGATVLVTMNALRLLAQGKV